MAVHLVRRHIYWIAFWMGQVTFIVTETGSPGDQVLF